MLATVVEAHLWCEKAGSPWYPSQVVCSPVLWRALGRKPPLQAGELGITKTIIWGTNQSAMLQQTINTNHIQNFFFFNERSNLPRTACWSWDSSSSFRHSPSMSHSSSNNSCSLSNGRSGSLSSLSDWPFPSSSNKRK